MVYRHGALGLALLFGAAVSFWLFFKPAPTPELPPPYDLCADVERFNSMPAGYGRVSVINGIIGAINARLAPPASEMLLNNMTVMCRVVEPPAEPPVETPVE